MWPNPLCSKFLSFKSWEKRFSFLVSSFTEGPGPLKHCLPLPKWPAESIPQSVVWVFLCHTTQFPLCEANDSKFTKISNSSETSAPMSFALPTWPEKCRWMLAYFLYIKNEHFMEARERWFGRVSKISYWCIGVREGISGKKVTDDESYKIRLQGRKSSMWRRQCRNILEALEELKEGQMDGLQWVEKRLPARPVREGGRVR